ncbi:MAG TPA: HEAT repeat domain-containing protein [Candidatus Acidoferrales bacterium]
MENNTRSTAARAFVRSLNILLKFARMYDLGHPRTAKQFEIAWSELRVAMGDDEAGLLLAVSGDKLLLDGTPLEASAAEKSFARMLSGAGIASIHFSPKVTHKSLTRFIRGFPTGSGPLPGQLSEQLKAALEGDPHIHVNEVCFVPADSAVAKTTMAAQLAARTLGMSPEQTDQLLNDPEKLLQLIVAAEGTKSGGGGGEGEPRRGAPRGIVELTMGGRNDQNAARAGTYSGDSKHELQGHGEGYGGGTGGVGGHAAVDGPALVVQGTGGSAAPNTWNIVGGTGGGTALDPNAGGFWLKKDAPGAEAGPVLAGPIATAGGSTGMAAGQTAVGPSADVGIASGEQQSGNRMTGREGLASRWTDASLGIRGSRSARTPGSTAVETGLMTLHEDELQGILQVLAQIARTNGGPQESLDMGSFQSRLSTLPRRARFTVSQALSALAAQAPSESSDKPTLLKLAEHIAVRFALESYERGDVKVNSVMQMLSEMSSELEGLRRILGIYEEKMSEAGIQVVPHVEALAQEFWSKMPAAKRREVLESADAWCVPPGRVREEVEGLKSRGETEAAEKILINYAECVKSADRDARRQAATGLAELAPVYASAGEKIFVKVIRETGVQLVEERDSELQSLVGAAFVRLSQEAAKSRLYPAMRRSVEVLDYLEAERPEAGKSLRPRISMEDRLPEFVDEAVRAGKAPAGLQEFLRRIPEAAAEQMAVRFGRAGFKEDCELLISMIEALGPRGLDHLRTQLLHGDPGRAMDVIGLLCRLDIEMVERALPQRMRDWKMTAHDRVVRQIASSGSTVRGQLLLRLFDTLDPMVRPLAIDEIGMSGEKSADMRLLRMAEGDLPSGATEFLRLKAIEALGRLRTAGAEAVLRRVAEARKAWRWAYASELRVAAAQSLGRIDEEWTRSFIPKSGLNVAGLSIEILDSDPNSSAMRQRRYPRVRLEEPISGTATNPKESLSINIPEIGLGGGVAVCAHGLHPGSIVEVRLSASQRPVKAQTIVRDANTQARAFEVVDMDLTERAKLRRLLVQLGGTDKPVTAEQRSRHGGRTIIVGS